MKRSMSQKTAINLVGMSEIIDPRFLAWYFRQVQLHPGGIVPLSIAAKACGITREGLMDACRRSKVRLLAWKTKPCKSYFVPLNDLLEWQATRPGWNLRGDRWSPWLQWRLKFGNATVKKHGNDLLCTYCGCNAKTDEPEQPKRKGKARAASRV